MRPIKVVKLVIIAAGIAGLVYVLVNYAGRGNGSQAKLYAIIPLLPAALLYAAADWYDNRERRKGVTAKLGEMGFLLDAPAGHAGDIHYTQAANHHSFSMRMYAYAVWQGRGARVAEFEYATGHGKGRQTFKLFQAAIECPADWPECELLPVPRSFQLAPDRAYKRGGKIGDAEFDRLWRVAGDAPGAAAMLSPALRQWLATRSLRESWRIGGGWLSCTWRGACDEKRTEQVLARVATFLSRAGARESVGVS